MDTQPDDFLQFINLYLNDLIFMFEECMDVL